MVDPGVLVFARRRWVESGGDFWLAWGMRAFAPLVAVVCCALGGCALWPWEPYPGWRVEIVAAAAVPRRVAEAFARDEPGVVAVQVERSVFRSRVQGYPARYRFWVSGTEAVVYDAEGRRSPVGQWFPAGRLRALPDRRGS